MPEYRRMLRCGGTYFFTLVTHLRRPFLCDDLARMHLRTAIDACRAHWPFLIDAFVLLPDHLHTIWTLPEQDSDYPLRWAWIKRRFTSRYLEDGGTEERTTVNQRLQRRRGVWQPRFWEHTVRDQRDLEHHLDYIHYNPVKHGHCRSPRDWPYSSFHRLVRDGVYDEAWSASRDQLDSCEWLAISGGAGE